MTFFSKSTKGYWVSKKIKNIVIARKPRKNGQFWSIFSFMKAKIHLQGVQK